MLLGERLSVIPTVVGAKMVVRLAKSLALTIPYIRRVHDGLEAMRKHIAVLEREKTERLCPPTKPELPPGESTLPGPEFVHFIDEAWCDLSGVFLRGWVHAGANRVRAVSLVSGSNRVTTTPFGFRPDVLIHYPHLPPEGAASFSAYLPCAPFTSVSIEVESDGGTASMPIALKSPADAEEKDADGAVEGFMSTMKAQGGTVLELGARIVGSMTEGWRGRLEPECRYIGNDIHPGPGIDVVGDVHNLSRYVAAGSLDGIFSVAVLEHLAAPWIAAAEINRALQLGGETLHVTHQTWPLHETPNDFFRMSDQALRSLFGPRTGFEVIECGMAVPVSIVPPLHLRYLDWLRVPIGRGYGQSYVRARKVCELSTSAQQQDDLITISRAYPAPRPN